MMSSSTSAPARSAKVANPATTNAAQQAKTANTLHYPFTILELSENALPAPVPPPDAPAA